MALAAPVASAATQSPPPGLGAATGLPGGLEVDRGRGGTDRGSFGLALDQHTISVVNSAGFVPVGWTVDTLGWKATSGGITTQIVLNRVLGSLRAGEIVLMHCGSNPDDHSALDAAALPAVIQSLQARGYSLVTMDALSDHG